MMTPLEHLRGSDDPHTPTPIVGGSAPLKNQLGVQIPHLPM